MKRKLAVLLAGIVAVSGMTMGCGGSAAQESGSKEEKNAVTVSLLSWYNEDYIGEFIDGFEAENPGVKIDLQYVPPTQQYVDKFMVLAASGQMTDMFFMAAENKQEIIEKNLAQDLSALPIFERIDSKVSSVWGNDGKIYGYAPDAWVGGIYYNKDLFQKAGIENEPKTWDEMVAAMQKLKDSGVEPYLDPQDAVYNLGQDLYFDMVISKDREADIKINNGEATFEELYTEPMTLWYNDLVKTGLYSQTSLGLSGDQLVDMFATGEVAMMHGGPWHIAQFKEKNPDLNYDIFPLPDPDGNQVLSGAVNVGMSISSSTKQKEICEKFLTYMSSDENILKWQAKTGNAVVVDGIDYKMNTVFDKFQKDAVEGNFYWPPCVWNNSAGILKEYVAATQDAMTGADSIDNVTKRMDEKMKELSE